MDLKKNTVYLMNFPNGETAKVSLFDIHRYPASGMPADCIFRCYTDCSLNKNSTMDNGWPFPEAFLQYVEMTELTDSLSVALLDNLEVKIKQSRIDEMNARFSKF